MFVSDHDLHSMSLVGILDHEFLELSSFPDGKSLFVSDLDIISRIFMAILNLECRPSTY